MRNHVNPANRKKRQESAKARATHIYAPEEQLARLDEKLGAGVGAKKERAKLNSMIYGKKRKK